MISRKRLSNISFQSCVMILVYGWVLWDVHFEVNRYNYLVREQNLQEIVIENVDYLQSLTNTSKKYPTSGIAIIQDGKHRFNAFCIGLSQFCQINQRTPLPSKTTIILLWAKNSLDSPEIKTGLIKEIRSPEGIIAINNKQEINEYLSEMKEKYIIGWLIEAFALILFLWSIINFNRDTED